MDDNPINIRRVEINNFANLLLEYVKKDEVYSKVKFIYPNVIVTIKNCIREDDYKCNHNLKIRYGKRLNEINYETLCDIVCDIVKHTKEKLPDAIHKRIIFGKMNEAVREYVRL